MIFFNDELKIEFIILIIFRLNILYAVTLKYAHFSEESYHVTPWSTHGGADTLLLF